MGWSVDSANCTAAHVRNRKECVQSSNVDLLSDLA